VPVQPGVETTIVVAEARASPSSRMPIEVRDRAGTVIAITSLWRDDAATPWRATLRFVPGAYELLALPGTVREQRVAFGVSPDGGATVEATVE
jgi:hypothetical protein